jgi:hypothetical protein
VVTTWSLLVVARTDPLLAETVRGLGGRGRAQSDYLLYLALQAVVVFVWWPKSTLREVLAAGEAPNTLLAAVIAAGVATAWFAARAGAEEVLLPGQHGLRDWAAATPLALGRILGGYVAGHLLHTVHLLALSAPLLLTAFSVSGGEWDALGGCLTAIVFQATFYRLAGASVYLSIGHFGAMSILSVRAIVVLTYALTTAFAPAASPLALSARLLGAGAPALAPGAALPAPLAFVLLYAAASAALLALLHVQLARARRGAAAAT